MLTKLSAADLARTAAVTTMSDEMPGYKTGAESRRKILAALLEREPRTVNELAEVVGITQQAMARTVDRLERASWVRVERRRGRRGSAVRLTEAGRLAAKTV